MEWSAPTGLFLSKVPKAKTSDLIETNKLSKANRQDPSSTSTTSRRLLEGALEPVNPMFWSSSKIQLYNVFARQEISLFGVHRKTMETMENMPMFGTPIKRSIVWRHP